MGAVPYTVRPLMPTNLQITTTPNEPYVTLAWTNPSTNSDGSPLTSISGVKIIRNGEIIADLTGMLPGQPAQYDDTVPEPADYRYTILAYTDVQGLYCFTNVEWIGPPAWAVPTGPDAYGYTALESIDPDGPDFLWNEIAPAAGGSGNIVTALINEDDRSTVVDLPFTFKFYGLEYDEITICTNGWLAFGDCTPDSDYSNTAIPNSDGPAAMLAPFWEDMNLENGGEIATYYDVVEGYFIIEFYRVPQWSPANTYETFEVILYDPSQWVNPTGDGTVLFQYLDITDPTEATFGIENLTEAVGLEIGYNDGYPASVSGIEDNYAIIFNPPAEEFPVSVTLTPESPPVVIPASGGSFNFDIYLSAPVSTSSFDVWIDVVLPNGSQYGPLLSRSLTLPSGQSIMRSLTQSIPGNAPQGSYTYRAFIGDEALGVIWSCDTFDFQKDGVMENQPGTWQCLENAERQAALENSAASSDCVLLTNAPNPFNPTTAISYQLSANSFVNLSVYDVSGRLVAVLVNGWRDVGIHEVTFDASGLASGIYLTRISTGDFQQTQRMLLVK